MERSVVRETVAGVIIRGVVATIGVEKAFDILAEIEKEESVHPLREISPGYYWFHEEGEKQAVSVGCELPHEKLKRIRGERGMKQKEMADIIGVSRTMYSLIERGDRSQKYAVHKHLEKAEAYLRDNPVTAHTPVAPIAEVNPLEADTQKAEEKVSPEKYLNFVLGAKESLPESLSYTITRKRLYPERAREETVRVAREAILKHISEEGELKEDFLRRLCKLQEVKPMSYKEMWMAESELRSSGLICQEKRATKDGERLFLFKPSDEKKFPAHEIVKAEKPELSETAKAAIAPEVKSLRKEILMETGERAAEIILENLSRHKEEGLPKEHAVALCMFENISHGAARETISLLTGRGILGFRMGESNGKNVPFIYLTEKGKEGK